MSMKCCKLLDKKSDVIVPPVKEDMLIQQKQGRRMGCFFWLIFLSVLFSWVNFVLLILIIWKIGGIL